MSILISNSIAQEASASSANQEFSFASLMPLFLIFAIFYFLIIRPQSRKIKEHQQLINNLKNGDKVITNGGIIGIVRSIKDSEVEIEISTGVNVWIVRSFIADLLDKKEEKKVVKKLK